MELEFAVAPGVPMSYPFVLRGLDRSSVDWEPAIRALLEIAIEGRACVMAARFHNMLGEHDLAVARRCDQAKGRPERRLFSKPLSDRARHRSAS